MTADRKPDEPSRRGCPDIERLLLAIAQRIRQRAEASEASSPTPPTEPR